MHTGTTADIETERLGALQDLAILDTAPEPEFDDLIEIAAAICGAPISLVSFVDQRRQWFKAQLGINFSECSREIAFCDHTIQQPDLFLVEDAALDPRFADNPLVTGEAGVRFYAGVPVTSPDGHSVGALCVLDREPRTLSREQRAALRVLARQVKARLELRVQRLKLERALAEAEAAKARLAASEQRFQTFMDSGPFLSYLKDPDGRIVYYNEQMARHFNVSRTFLLNKTDAELWPASLAASYREHDTMVLRSGALQVVEEETRNPDDSISVWRSYKFPCTGTDGCTLLGGVSIEVTEEQRREARLKLYQEELESANRRLSELAVIDALTGIANRRAFDDGLRRCFRTARNAGTPLCLLLLDVDNFKQHNDRFGHQHGDTVLRQLAETLGAQLRAGDLIARYGGEELAVVLPNTSEDNARRLADRLLAAVRSRTWANAPVTVSAGLSALCPATRDTQHLLGLADEALYAAKRAGKDRVVAYTEVYEQVLAGARNGAGEPAMAYSTQLHL